MKLQSDPTIIYALGDKFEGDIKKLHMNIKHPYNTYHIDGLPPGPIGLVSKSSIEAAVNPSDGTSLYFVSQGDGTHFFSDTLEEHNKAVKKYRSEEHTSELQSRRNLVCRLLLEKKKKKQ